MNIPPISFKGVITIKTKTTPNGEWQENAYRTTKKQDGLILKTAFENMAEIGKSKEILGKDTIKLHQTIEKTINKKIPQSNLTNPKFFYIGGTSGNDMYYEKYNTSYNKIYYDDTNSSQNKITNLITIDLMEPQERFKAAKEIMPVVQEKIQKIFHIQTPDSRLHESQLRKTNLPKEKYAKLEQVLNTTNEHLDKFYNGCKGPWPTFESSYQAYETLMKELHTALGIKYTPKEKDELKGIYLDFQDYPKISYLIGALYSFKY